MFTKATRSFSRTDCSIRLYGRVLGPVSRLPVSAREVKAARPALPFLRPMPLYRIRSPLKASSWACRQPAPLLPGRSERPHEGEWRGRGIWRFPRTGLTIQSDGYNGGGPGVLAEMAPGEDHAPVDVGRDGASEGVAHRHGRWRFYRNRNRSWCVGVYVTTGTTEAHLCCKGATQETVAPRTGRRLTNRPILWNNVLPDNGVGQDSDD